MNKTPVPASAYSKRAAPAALRIVCAVLMGGLLLGACSDDDSGQGPLEIIGAYADDFGTTHTITADLWTMDFGGDPATFDVLQYSNADDYLVAQNGAGNAFNPGLYSRFDWSSYQNELYFCQGTFDAASEAEAAAAESPDPSGPTAGGCGGFPWSRLTPQ